MAEMLGSILHSPDISHHMVEGLAHIPQTVLAGLVAVNNPQGVIVLLVASLAVGQ